MTIKKGVLPDEKNASVVRPECSDELSSLSRRKFMKSSAGVVLAAGGAGSLLSCSVNAFSANQEASGSRALEGSTEAICGVSLQIDPDIKNRYSRAQAYLAAVYGHPMTFNTTVHAHWIDGSDSFWYQRDSKNGKQFRLVDAAGATNIEAFDHQTLGRALERASGQKADANNLPINNIDVTLSPRQVRFSAFDKHWIFDSKTGRCQERPRPSDDNWVLSPDGSKAAFVRDYNLWIQDIETGREWALTDDGERYNVYASMPTAYGRQEIQKLDAVWSADSRRLLTHQMDTRQVPIGAPLVQHVPADGSLRPVVVDQERRVALPDGEHVDVYRFMSIDVETGEKQLANYRECPVFYPPYYGFFIDGRGFWGEDNRHAYFLDLERGGLTARLVEFDTHTGAARVVLEETSDSRINLEGGSAMLLPAGDEVIWTSERSGWQHLYLYNLKTGKLKHPITQGNWLVRNVLGYNARRRELVIQTAGRVAGRNPYYQDICRVNIDTGELTVIQTSDHEYTVSVPHNRALITAKNNGSGVSSSGAYMVATRSRADQPPTSYLFDCDGKKVLELEQADLSGLPDSWQWPEPVMLKAADGKTEVYGVVFRPSDFSPDKSWPVLDASFGDLAPVGSFTNNKSSSWMYLTPMAFTELGFVVVMIITRGNGMRDRKFWADNDAALTSVPLQEDSIVGIKQLAKRYPYMDMDRVGLAPLGSSAASVSGMLRYPEFYKVGVSANPAVESRLQASFFHDRLYKGPKLEGDKRIGNLLDYVENLRGKLLLVHGMMDNVLPVAMTFGLIDALQKANKNFDMLFLPNDGHNGSKYSKRRSWDYLVRHLRGVEPPDDFELDY